jgi:hypothetical protein
MLFTGRKTRNGNELWHKLPFVVIIDIKKAKDHQLQLKR